MNEVFVDTSGWANAFVKTEPYYAEASTLITQRKQQNRRVVTTNYVLSELIPLLTRRLRIPRERGLHYIETLRSADWIEIVHIDERLDKEAWKLLAERLDKQWSLVDAASFVVMRERGISEALATDKHFEQDGFVRLLK